MIETLDSGDLMAVIIVAIISLVVVCLILSIMLSGIFESMLKRSKLDIQTLKSLISDELDRRERKPSPPTKDGPLIPCGPSKLFPKPPIEHGNRS